ncbi:hypothetical protein A6V39_00910 [Candidatus Mycoplasma haematobovis]|uniref:Uncharacterized protein n=1 Tax=Candidatus Mycoplasma haematobovis TaxID=432608 RepID=A0A1A9QDE3_9MOLU|nr:hypothetical protein [Candidatus Mycoplasma haematobovis]OAL10612.1 hypothetical protein A6V39_00910 [Candidatus Mycoplasma haematobovis]
MKLLSKSEPKDNDKWNTNWQKFQQANNSDTAPSVPWNFSDWKTTRVKTTAPEEFKTECEKHGAQTAINEQNSSYIATSTYCSKGIDE